MELLDANGYISNEFLTYAEQRKYQLDTLYTQLIEAEKENIQKIRDYFKTLIKVYNLLYGIIESKLLENDLHTATRYYKEYEIIYTELKNYVSTYAEKSRIAEIVYDLEIPDTIHHITNIDIQTKIKYAIEDHYKKADSISLENEAVSLMTHMYESTFRHDFPDDNIYENTYYYLSNNYDSATTQINLLRCLYEHGYHTDVDAVKETLKHIAAKDTGDEAHLLYAYINLRYPNSFITKRIRQIYENIIGDVEKKLRHHRRNKYKKIQIQFQNEHILRKLSHDSYGLPCIEEQFRNRLDQILIDRRFMESDKQSKDEHKFYYALIEASTNAGLYLITSKCRDNIYCFTDGAQEYIVIEAFKKNYTVDLVKHLSAEDLQNMARIKPKIHTYGRGLEIVNAVKKEFRTSSMERKAGVVLKKYGISFQREVNIGAKCIKNLPYDIGFTYKNTKCLIECDGQQHFKSSDFFGGDEAFERTVKHDKIKTEYAENNGYKLLRIAYYENINDKICHFLANI